jgi:hypothetical protein
MLHRHVTTYGPPLLVEGSATVLKNLDWFEAVRMVDPEQTSLEELKQFPNDLFIFFPEGLATEAVIRFHHHIIVSDCPQNADALVVLSPFDSLKTFRVGVLSALSGQYYRSPRFRKPTLQSMAPPVMPASEG